MDAIIIESLVKHFHSKDKIIKAVDDLSLTIPQGKIVGLLGPNGAGKTTTIRMIASIYSPTTGTIKINGLDSQTQSLQVRSSIGIAHENPSFYKKLSGRRNLRFYAELYDVNPNEIDKRIDNLAKDFDLEEAIDQPVGGYSKGMRQKLSVAKALIHDPDILIMDEPWSGLSPGATRDLRRKILDLGKQGKTILITTHNLAQAELVADKLIVISVGKLVARGTPDELRAKYHINPQLIIHVNGRPDAAVLSRMEQESSIIKNFDLTKSADGKNQLVIDVDSFEQTSEVIETLIKSGIKIREVRENIPSLEEIYLQLVEEEN